jgi:hypothetical protein
MGYILYIYMFMDIYNIYILVNCVCNGMDINLETSLEWNDDH